MGVTTRTIAAGQAAQASRSDQPPPNTAPVTVAASLMTANTARNQARVSQPAPSKIGAPRVATPPSVLDVSSAAQGISQEQRLGSRPVSIAPRTSAMVPSFEWNQTWLQYAQNAQAFHPNLQPQYVQAPFYPALQGPVHQGVIFTPTQVADNQVTSEALPSLPLDAPVETQNANSPLAATQSAVPPLMQPQPVVVPLEEMQPALPPTTQYGTSHSETPPPETRLTDDDVMHGFITPTLSVAATPTPPPDTPNSLRRLRTYRAICETGTVDCGHIAAISVTGRCVNTWTA